MADNGCPSTERLMAYLVGDLSEEVITEVAAHLEVCPACDAEAGRLDSDPDGLLEQIRRLHQDGLRDGRTKTHAGGSDEWPVFPEAGREWGEFRIVREIGRGGMGVVCEAFQGSMRRHVAVKFLPASGDLAPVPAARRGRPGGCTTPTSCRSSAWGNMRAGRTT